MRRTLYLARRHRALLAAPWSRRHLRTSLHRPPRPRMAQTNRRGLVNMEPLGDLLNSLGLEHEPADGELIASALVLLKVIGADGEVALRTVTSDGLSWIERVGLLRVAEKVELDGFAEIDD